jgi:peptidoglycan L-alanyl-D-glutamate endopeptidase CwlK
MTPFDDQSAACLRGVHPDLVSVVTAARQACPFRVTEGLRTLARQKKLLAQKKSRTLNSRHLTGHAVDLVDMAGTYTAAEMTKIAAAMKDAAEQYGVAITWGGDWVSFKDTPHFELSWHEYPKSDMAARVKVGLAGASVPAVPAVATTNVGNAESWQGLATQVTQFGGWLVGNPWPALVAVLLAFVLGWVVPRYVGVEEGE